jgi:DNA-binding PadR family transcriptional regulator
VSERNGASDEARAQWREPKRAAERSRREAPTASANIERFLPLTPVVLEIALSLAAGERHGYEIMQDVERRTDGRIVLHPGTLYRALARLLDQKLIEELDERPARSRASMASEPRERSGAKGVPASERAGEFEGRSPLTKDDERRRYYRLTALGHAVTRAEVQRLTSQVSAARRLFRGGRA